MAKIHCAISGITFSCDHGSLVIRSEEGYFHPIFALPYKKLYGLYSKHCSGQLPPTDSYLLFLAFLHSTEQVAWNSPATCNPNDSATISLIENNIHQLIRVVELTNCIVHPSFSQPSFSVNPETSSLAQIPNWIAAWEDNVADFRYGRKAKIDYESLQKAENRLSHCIKSGMEPKYYAGMVASWASKAAEFPPANNEAWCKLIRSCFNSSKMFATPISEIREVKEFCEENIEAGSIHFHALMSTLREGISRHTDFLGLGTSNSLGYMLLPSESTKNQTEVEAILAKATDSPPVRTDYTSQLDYIKAKLRYRVATLEAKKKPDTPPDTQKSSDTNISQEPKL